MLETCLTLCYVLNTNKMILYLLKILFKFDVHVTMHHDKISYKKPTICTNFSNLFLE